MGGNYNVEHIILHIKCIFQYGGTQDEILDQPALDDRSGSFVHGSYGWNTRERR